MKQTSEHFGKRKILRRMRVVGGKGHIMSLLEIPWNPSRRQLCVFAMLLAAGLMIVAVLMANRQAARALPLTLFSTALACMVAGIVWPPLLKPVYQIWMLAAFPIGWTVSHLLLAAVFFLVVSPIGLARRAWGADPLRRKFDRQAESDWIDRRRENNPRRYFRQF